jgi:DNA primase
MKLISADSNRNSEQFAKNIKLAKLLLPLEKMLEQLEDWEQCVAKKRCPFHANTSPSFSVFIKEDNQYWKCHAGCGAGDQINYLEHKFDLNRGEALRLFLEMAGISHQDNGGLHV